MQAWSILLDFIWSRRRADHDKDIEILLLRHQLRILQRQHSRAPHISRWEKLTLVVLAGQLTALIHAACAPLGQVVLLFKPETLLKWHRELVWRRWTFKQRAQRGRPPTSAELEALRLARENPTWGYGKLEGKVASSATTLGAQPSAMSSRASAFHQHLNALSGGVVDEPS